MTDEPYKAPDHAIPYLKLIKLGVPTWNKWIKGELTEAEAADVAAKLAPTPVPVQPLWLGNMLTNSINFSGVNFTVDENVRISFEDVVMGDLASFERAVFGENFSFRNATFNGFISFADAKFDSSANFLGAKFLGMLNGKFPTWVNTKFLTWVSFKGATFGGGAIFKETIFKTNAVFQSASFGVGASFEKAVFNADLSFENASIGGHANFRDAIFCEKADFSGMHRTQLRKRLREEIQKKDLPEDQRETEAKERLVDEGQDKMEAIYFRSARFKGEALFRNRQFKNYANFSNVRFDMPPTFENCEGMERMDVTGTQFGFSGRRPKYLWWGEEENSPGWTMDPNIPTRLRILRKQMEDIKAHDAERDLFIAERMAERGVLIDAAPRSLRTLGALFLFFMYQALSDCGRSLSRPAMIFGFKFAIFFYVYLGLIPHGIEERWSAVLSFTIGHSLPFVSSLSKVQEDVLRRLFENCQDKLIHMPIGIEILSILQSLIGALLLFLFLQAVRNHFRLR